MSHYKNGLEKYNNKTEYIINLRQSVKKRGVSWTKNMIKKEGNRPKNYRCEHTTEGGNLCSK